MDFEKSPKIPRFSRDCIVTEKIDGTNAQVYIEELPVGVEHDPYRGVVQVEDRLYGLYVGSRTRWLTLSADNAGFCRWVHENGHDIVKGLGPGRHYGEWWGRGIQRGYGLDHKRFSLFNVTRWHPEMFKRFKVGQDGEQPVFQAPPECCHVVPVIGVSPSLLVPVDVIMDWLQENGSFAAPGFDRPEGIVIYHTQGNVLFKKTFEGDEKGKSYGA